MTVTDPTPTIELDVDTARLVSRLIDLQAKIADLTSEAEAVKAELRSLNPGDYAIGGQPALRITPTRRFDATKALEYVAEPLREKCYTSAVDPKKVKEYLPPAVADLCMVESGKPKVTVL
jgi:hypothetical protein